MPRLLRFDRRLRLLLALGAISAAACEDGDVPTTPAGQEFRVPAAVAWNLALTEIVGAHPWTPPHAARTFAYLGVAQHEAVLELEGGPAEGVAIAERAAVATASVAILRAFYPAEETRIAAALRRLAPRAGTFGSRAVIDIGRAAGSRAAERALERLAADGGDAVWSGQVPTGPGMWFSSTGQPPLAPMAGEMVPWTMDDVSAFDPPPPPAFGSAAAAFCNAMS